MESCPPKKLWQTLRIAMIMMRKGVSKTKPSFVDDINLVLNNNRTTITTTKKQTTKKNTKTKTKSSASSVGKLQHQNSFSCKSDVDVRYSFVSPKEYEFSCHDSPAQRPFRRLTNTSTATTTTMSRRNKPPTVNHRKYRYQHNYQDEPRKTYKAIEAPATPLALPGFGESPVVPVRVLRVTDSPFPVKVESEEERLEANREAEEFIRKFRRQLAVESMTYHRGGGGGLGRGGGDGRFDEYYGSFDHYGYY